MHDMQFRVYMYKNTECSMKFIVSFQLSTLFLAINCVLKQQKMRDEKKISDDDYI